MSMKAIYQTITDEIISSIKNKELMPGGRIPSIKNIKEKYNVSQITALRVFKELTESGYVTRKMGSGYFVSNIKVNQKPDLIVCCVHPPRAINNYDNWGNNVNYGIIQESLEYRMGLLYPSVAGVLRNGSLSSDGPVTIASGISSIAGKIAGILLAWQVTDEDIKKHILPTVGNIPLVVVGRSSALPLSSISLPNKEGAIDAAKLAVRTGYKRFIICKHVNPIFSTDRCNSFKNELLRAGIAEEKISVIDNVFSTKERDNEVLNIIENEIKNNLEKLLVFTSSDSIGRFTADRLAERNIHWGRDAGLISFDGMEMAYNSTPRLATVAVSGEQMGRLAVKTLMEYGSKPVQNCVADYKIEINDTI